LLSYAVAATGPGRPEVRIDALETLDRLHRRYATYSAYPGRPLRFLKNLLADRQWNKPISAADVAASFSAETGLPLFMLDDAKPLNTTATQTWFQEQVLGQDEAGRLVVDTIATVKARLARPGRPIASFLFIGPTGVGKTEMAKSLAQFLFQDRRRMIGFDMSEYARPDSVRRLIGGLGGEYGTEGLLTSKVREQTFSVVLLDEFEKADSSFFDLLLQVLGEGRLTDASGRLADFSNCVVIMTSNLGAETFKGTSLGFTSHADGDRAREHFLREVRDFVRPEILNRIDRIVPFGPLDERTIAKIASAELGQVMRRDGIRYRGVVLNLAPEVPLYLARKGYDARYGARPLKRAIERELLVPLSEELNARGSKIVDLAEVKVENDEILVTLHPAPAGEGDIGAPKAAPAKPVQGIVNLRREVQSLERSRALLQLRNEAYRLERLIERISKKTYKNAIDLDILARLPELDNGIKLFSSLSDTGWRHWKMRFCSRFTAPATLSHTGLPRR
jgi:ATP-dependent Clp protease ATP-binding subunit ClpC